MQLAVVDRDRHRRGKKRLGRRPDLEDGLRVDRRPALAADTEAFGVDQLVAGDDADRQARDVEALHVGCDIVLEARDKRLDSLFDRRFGRRRFGCGSAVNHDGKCDEGRDKCSGPARPAGGGQRGIGA